MQNRAKNKSKEKFQNRIFVPTEEGSATKESLNDERKIVGPERMNSGGTENLRGAPWSKENSLKFMCHEVGLSEDELIAGILENKSDGEMAKELGLPSETIAGLKKYFLTKGIASIQGQD